MKYDDAEHLMRLLEEGYPSMPVHLVSRQGAFKPDEKSFGRDYSVEFTNAEAVTSNTVTMLEEKSGREFEMVPYGEGATQFVWR